MGVCLFVPELRLLVYYCCSGYAGRSDRASAMVGWLVGFIKLGQGKGYVCWWLLEKSQTTRDSDVTCRTRRDVWSGGIKSNQAWERKVCGNNEGEGWVAIFELDGMILVWDIWVSCFAWSRRKGGCEEWKEIRIDRAICQDLSRWCGMQIAWLELASIWTW